VKLTWKIVYLALATAGSLLGSGCSGIRASQGVSPASFLLPGLMQAEPVPAGPVLAPIGAEPKKELARS
jgi:hypothetical protein